MIIFLETKKIHFLFQLLGNPTQNRMKFSKIVTIFSGNLKCCDIVSWPSDCTEISKLNDR